MNETDRIRLEEFRARNEAYQITFPKNSLHLATFRSFIFSTYIADLDYATY